MRKVLMVLSLLLPCIAMAQDSDAGKKLSWDANFTFEMGQIVKGRYGEQQDAKTYRHLWLDNVCGAFDVKGSPFGWLDLVLGFEGRMWYNTFPEQATLFQWGAQDVYYSFYLTQAQGIFSFLKDNPFNINMSFGYFPYKYNPEVRILGEYLFRTGTYPVYIINKFDSPLARLGGLRITLNYGTDLLNIKFDQLIVSEREYRPLHDFTLASIVGVNIAKFADVGFGVSFAHAMPINKELTTPERYETMIYQERLDGVDTIRDTLGYYTFKGAKLMFRGTIDPFAGLRGQAGFLDDFLGDYGGKLYAELGIIGLKNYEKVIFLDTGAVNSNPWGYEKRSERMPIAFGFTLPCWKILDICAFEFEYINSPYPNSYKIVYQQGWPLPVIPSMDPEYDKNIYKEGDWKFIVYMKKYITEHFNVMLQMGRDHMRWEVNGVHGPNFDFEDALVKKGYKDKNGDWVMGHWAWRFKTEFKF